MTRSVQHWILGFLVLLQFSCAELPETESRFFAEDNPVKLSSWSLLHQDGARLRIADNAQVYYLASGLFSDYALKLRTVSIPAASSIPVTDTGEMQFPVGTVISKTFYYAKSEAQALLPDGELRVVHLTAAEAEIEPTLNLDRVALLETRLLVRRSDGWHALPYVWDADQQDATLRIAGAMLPVSLNKNDQVRSFAYVAPNQNQCTGCHTLDHGSKRIEPIGPQAKHLNRLHPGSGENQ